MITRTNTNILHFNRLRAGWSSRAQSDNLAGSINEAEQAIITQVLERANKAQEMEEERVR